MPAVGERLRGFVDDGHDFIQRQRFLDHDRGHHGAGRSAADGAGDLRFDVMHQHRIRGDLLDTGDALAAGIGGKGFIGALRTDKTAQQPLQIGHAGAAAPEA